MDTSEGVGITTTMSGSREHDNANYPATFSYRGNLVMAVTPAGRSCRNYDNGGNVVQSINPDTLR